MSLKYSTIILSATKNFISILLNEVRDVFFAAIVKANLNSP